VTTGAALIAKPGAPSTAAALGDAVVVGDRRDDRGGVTLAVLPTFGWRAVFFVGVLLAVLWIRKDARVRSLARAQEKKPVS
jgi:hypothetical protein